MTDAIWFMRAGAYIRRRTGGLPGIVRSAPLEPDGIAGIEWQNGVASMVPVEELAPWVPDSGERICVVATGLIADVDAVTVDGVAFGRPVQIRPVSHLRPVLLT